MYNYSKRLSWSPAVNPLSELKHARQLAGLPILDLTISNPVEAGFHYPHARIAEIFGAVRDLSYRPHPFGEISARAAVAGYYAQHQISIDPQQIALTASTSEAYSILFKLLCDPGDEVLVPTPSYPLFDFLAALDSVRVVPYRLLYAGNWFIDLEHLEYSISARTRAIVLVNPNNPTGSFLKLGEHAALVRIAEAHGLPLISDEVFMEYPVTTQADLVRTLAQNTNGLGFSVNGLSKTTGMPQVKLGWIVIHGERSATAAASERLEHILDTYLSVGTPVQKALPDLLTAGVEIRQQIQRRITGNIMALPELLRCSPAQMLHLEGGWSAIVQLPAIQTEEDWVSTLIRDYGVAVQPGYFFDMASEAYIVVSLLAGPDELTDGISRLVHLLTRT